MAVSGNLGGKISVVDNVLSFHEQIYCPSTSLEENCIEFEIQTDRNYYVDLRQMYLALEMKFVKGRDYETYNSIDNEKEQKEETKADEETAEGEQEAPVPLVAYLNNFLHSVFFNVEVYINNSHFYNPNGS